MGKAAEFTESSFESDVLKSEIPVLVDFWAPSCGPCRMIAPLIEELAGSYEGRVKVGKVDVSEHQGLAIQYGIQNIPALLVFKNGVVQSSFVGVPGKSKLVGALDSVAE